MRTLETVQNKGFMKSPTTIKENNPASIVASGMDIYAMRIRFGMMGLGWSWD
jgi:hypothetical protein